MALGWSIGARLLRWLAGSAFTLGAFFVLAGRWDLPWLWTTGATASLLGLAMFLTIDPGLARERRRPGPGGVDRRTQLLLATVMGAEVVIACLDVGRFHWSDSVPPGLRAAGLLLFGAGYGLVIWSVAVNRFFSSVVRVQAERGHTIITAGPYRYVRHPGYLGMLMSYPVVSLAIGSWWAVTPGALCFGIVLRRAVLEDAYLREHLPGYRDYAASVPSRLLPGVW
jgi:protein-S-isoprenylcysteine O-methyltransferase Ste14